MVIIVTVGMVFSWSQPAIRYRRLVRQAPASLRHPPFVAAVILIGVFALAWVSLTFGEGDGLLDQLHHMTLPAALAVIRRDDRAGHRMSVMDELAHRVEVARLRGTILRRLSGTRYHRSRPSSLPPGSLIGGTTVVETAFGISGLGSLLVRSVARRDFPVIQAIGLLIVAVFAVALILVDILHARMDPRLTLSKARQR